MNNLNFDLIDNIISSTSPNIALSATLGSVEEFACLPWSAVIEDQKRVAAVALGCLENLKLITRCENLFKHISKCSTAIYNSSYYDRKHLQDSLAKLKAHILTFPAQPSEDISGSYNALTLILTQIDDLIALVRDTNLPLLKMIPVKQLSLYHEMLPHALQMQIITFFMSIGIHALSLQKLKRLYEYYEPLLYEKFLPEWIGKTKQSLFILNFSENDVCAIFPHLRFVDLSHYSSEDQHFSLHKVIARLENAQHVVIRDCHFSNATRAQLLKLKRLSSLKIASSWFNQPMQSDLSLFTGLQRLSICGSYCLSMEKMTSLRTLIVADCTLTHQNMENLTSLSLLQELRFKECRLAPLTILTALKQLQLLKLDHCRNFSCAGASLISANQLTALSITSEELTDEDSKIIGLLTHLQSLTCIITQMTKSNFAYLNSFTHLRQLILGGA